MHLGRNRRWVPLKVCVSHFRNWEKTLSLETLFVSRFPLNNNKFVMMQKAPQETKVLKPEVVMQG